MAASRPRLRTSCSPTLKELNWPRSGSGFTTSAPPFAYTIGRQRSFILAHDYQHFIHMGKVEAYGSGEERFGRCETASEPADAGGQGSSALSRPMREDSPAARITPQRARVRPMRGR